MSAKYEVSGGGQLSAPIVFRVLVPFLLFTLFVGCSDAASDRNVGYETESFSVLNGVALGSGVQLSTPRTDPPIPTHQVCLDLTQKVEDVSAWMSRAFYTHKLSDVERHLNVSVEGDVKTEEIEADTAWNWAYDGSESAEEEVLSIVAHVQTVRRFTERGSSPESSPPNFCDSPHSWTYNEFNANCGSGYLQQEVMGGYVILTTRVSNLTKSEKRTLDGNLNVEVGPGSGTLTTKMQWLYNSSMNSMSFEVSSFGISPPDPSLLDGDGRIGPAGILRYINNVKSSYQSAVYNDEIEDPSYGNVVQQEFARYTQGDYTACGLDGTADELDCYDDFQHERHELQADRDWLLRKLELADWKKEHENRVDWPHPEPDAIEEYEEAVSEVSTCLEETVPGRQEQCNEAFQSAKYSALCEACSFPNECDPDRSMQSSMVCREQTFWSPVSLQPTIRSPYLQDRT